MENNNNGIERSVCDNECTDKSALIVLIGEFVLMCEMGYISDIDGIGYYGSKDSESRYIATPSDICTGNIDKSYSHIWWYSN